MDSEKCFICDEKIDKDEDISSVRKKGITSLIKASYERNDGKHSLIESLDNVNVHTLCRKKYTRPTSIKAVTKGKSEEESSLSKNIPLSSTLRSSAMQFDFKTKCLFCTEVIDENFKEKQKKKPLNRRRTVYEVRSLAFKNTIIEAAEKRTDDWSNQVKLRLGNVNDLVAADGIYHHDCYVKFTQHIPSQTGQKCGNPGYEYVTAAINEICTFLENNDDCQHSMTDLISVISGEVPTERCIKDKLKNIYGDNIIITTSAKKESTVCFMDTGRKKLATSWYDERKENEAEEKLRIVKTAAEIIREDIQSYICDSKCYPPSNAFLKNAASDVPDLLITFLQHLTKSKKKKTASVEDEINRKCVAIAHSIVHIVRPRSFVSCILDSLSLFLYRKFGSKSLINLISSLGFCSPYYNAQLLEMSAIHQGQPETDGLFCQFVFDNADFNVSTIDGLNTFHAMGGISCVTPASSLKTGKEIAKVKGIPPAKNSSNFGVLPVEIFEIKACGLKDVVMETLPDLPETIISPSVCDTLWMCAQWLKLHGIPGWKGFMHVITKGLYSEKSKIIPVPFINSPPSNLDTVYTAIRFAAQYCEKIKQNTIILTFDQPLYMKCKEILAASSNDTKLSKYVVRLGGFHLLMSFLGCIGYLMGGSGLKELFCTVYAPLSVDKMLQGKAYSRAVRGHILLQNVLARIIFSQIDINQQERQSVIELTKDFIDESPVMESINNNVHLKSLALKFEEKLMHLKQNGPTAALWIQYFNMVSLMKLFINAERFGDWDLHLKCVQLMIPYFHACGHFPYAKACHLYLQDMLNIQTIMTEQEYDKFVRQSYFTIRRTDKFWTGVWTDMIIEQTLMRSMKSTGGLTRGRGITDNVLSKWILSATATFDICTSLEEFCNLSFSYGEQHEDFRGACAVRDAADIIKLSAWLDTHQPFPQINEIVSIATGIVGDESITCFKAAEIGKKSMLKVFGKRFSEIKLSRKDRALPLDSINSSIKVDGNPIPVDALVIFQRISICKQNDEDLMKYLKFELAPYPLSLFDGCGMRKTKKSALYKIFEATDDQFDIQKYVFIVDGGFLLHKISWPKSSTVLSICNSYINFLKKHYSSISCTVVFDGYTDTSNSTKVAEQHRRCIMKMSVDINFDDNTVISVPQDEFLSNKNNKARLIETLSSKLNGSGIQCHQSSNDADTLIVRSAIEKAKEYENVAVVGEDVDLLVLLTALTPTDLNIFFYKPGRGKTETQVFPSKLQQQKCLKDIILFAHAFTGCDTTSALFRKGKLTSCKLLLQSAALRSITDVFNHKHSTHKEVMEAGNKYFLTLYGAPSKTMSLNMHRYHAFTKAASNMKPDLPSLPPTEGAAMQHSFRVFHQVQLWKGNELPAEFWGWKRRQNGTLMPVTTKDAVAPEEVLNLIFCKCTTGCGKKCGCRKLGMTCTTICHNCHGDCLNGLTLEEADLNIDDEVGANL